MTLTPEDVAKYCPEITVHESVFGTEYGWDEWTFLKPPVIEALIQAPCVQNFDYLIWVIFAAVMRRVIDHISQCLLRCRHSLSKFPLSNCPAFIGELTTACAVAEERSLAFMIRSTA